MGNLQVNNRSLLCIDGALQCCTTGCVDLYPTTIDLDGTWTVTNPAFTGDTAMVVNDVGWATGTLSIPRPGTNIHSVRWDTTLQMPIANTFWNEINFYFTIETASGTWAWSQFGSTPNGICRFLFAPINYIGNQGAQYFIQISRYSTSEDKRVGVGPLTSTSYFTGLVLNQQYHARIYRFDPNFARHTLNGTPSGSIPMLDFFDPLMCEMPITILFRFPLQTGQSVECKVSQFDVTIT